MRRRFFVVCGLACGLVLAVTSSGPRPLSAAGLELPQRLSDVNFWKLSADWSEANGYFRSDNLTSNELLFQNVVGDLMKRTRPGRVYLGVGPEQNYTYMAAVRPAMAIIFDIRRGNLDLQLMYKALFELASDRADFVSMLFAKPRPAGLTSKSTVVQIFSAFSESPTSETLYQQTLKAIDANLTRTHAFPVPAVDLDGIEYVYHAFYWAGFAVRPNVTYDELMTATDGVGGYRSYLASEENFQFLKKLQSQNLVIPVVADFGGPKAIRAVGAYLKAHDALVSTFYLSNVEQYLSQDGKWSIFCKNVATLPLDAGSTFIRSTNRGFAGFGGGPGFVSSLGSMAEEVKNCGP